MANPAWFVCILGLLTIFFHLLPLLGLSGLWGLDAPAYLPRTFSLAWSALAALLLLPPLFERWLAASSAERLPQEHPDAPGSSWNRAWLIAPAALIFFPFLAVATPLLGDGLDRMAALARGFKALRGQPAPLDIALHLALFHLAPWVPLGKTAFFAAWKTYRILSYLAGAFALLAGWALARHWGTSAWQKALVFGGLLGMGTTLLFCGYPENYSLLAAMLLIHLWLLDRSLQPNRSPLWPLLSLLVMIGLHFFALLLLPPTFYVLFRSGRWRPGRAILALLIGVGLAFLAFLLLMVERHYRGTAAIFLAPDQIFSASRLLDFFNQQLLVCPALLPLLYLALKKRHRFPTGDLIPEKPFRRPILNYLAGASLIWLVFFYALRPVLGAGPDWDLFSLPALVYTPWLLLRARDTISHTPRGRYLAWAVLVVSFYHTIPWIAVNARHDASIARYENLLAGLEGNNPWAAGYGWLKLGKYWQHLGRTEAALSAYDRSIAANPDYSVLYREVGQQMLELGRLDLAVERFQGFLEHNPTNPGAKPALAKARKLYAEHLEWQGRGQEAAAQYQAILDLYPGQPEAQAALARVRAKLQAGEGKQP